MPDENTASREEILSHLENLTGWIFRSREDVQKYMEQLATERKAIQARSVRAWRQVEQTALLLFMVLAFVQYYLVDVMHELMYLSSLTIFVPVTARDMHSALQLVSGYIS